MLLWIGPKVNIAWISYTNTRQIVQVHHFYSQTGLHLFSELIGENIFNESEWYFYLQLNSFFSKVSHFLKKYPTSY